MALPKSLLEATVYFSDPDNALEFVKRLRWPDGVTCPRCESKDHYFLKTRRVWKCKDCKKQFSVKVGTIFEDSALGLDKWLVAIWLTANAKNGVSSCELSRALGITQKSAWHLQHRIRLAMETRSFRKLSGTVEADETFVGGKKDPRRHKNAPKGGPGHKTPVFGMLERGGEVRAYTIPNVKGETLKREIEANVWPGSELYTDGHQGYVRMKKEYIHKSVNHLDIWAIGEIHTNNIENFWCLFKRSIKGTWIRPSPRHMDRYATDQAFRYNNRHTDDLGRFATVTAQIVGRRLTWDNLVGR